MPLKLKIIIGSTRPGRVGPKIATWFETAAREHGGFEVELLDLADFNLPVYDEPNHPRMQAYVHEHTKKLSAAIAPGDAYVFVTPEYNSNPPASLLNALTYLSLEWGYKPAGILSYAFISGGLRAVENLKPVLTALNMMAIPQALPVPLFTTMLDEAGTFTPSEPVAQGVKPFLDELALWADGLKKMRGANAQ